MIILQAKNGSYKIEENLGTYYMEDLKLTPTSEPTSVSDVNKNEKRVITYIFKPI